MRHLRWAAASLSILALGACGGDEKATAGGGETAETSKTLAEAVKDHRGLDTLEAITTNAGLTAVLESRGPYTVFAPSDAGFQATGEDFAGEAMKAQGAALVRAHIVPGALTRRDIEAAIAGDADGKVEMRTMGDGMLTFSRDGDLLKVTAPDGATASLAGQEVVASNGVLQPMDAVLMQRDVAQ